MLKDYSAFTISSLILQFQTFHKKLEEKKESGKQLTNSEKQSDKDISRQIIMRVAHLKNISAMEERHPSLFYHTIFPPNALIIILGKKIRGKIIGYEGKELALVSLIDKIPSQPTITKIAVPFTQLRLQYVEL